MKKTLILVYTGVIFILMLSACNAPPSTSSPVDPPDEAPKELPAGVPSVDAPPVPTETQEIPVINLAGPELGTQMRWFDNSLLIFVPDGEFIMGATYENPQDHPEHPEHVVDQSGFWIYRSEVNNGMYANCVADGGCTEPATNITTDYLNPEKRNHPVVGVDWYQAQAYCSWADGHLPTESQWEKTARGPDGNIYPWGDAKPDCDLLNFNNCVNEKLSSGSYLSTTSPIRKYFDGESFYEALDMAGNVFEWAQDWYKSDYYQESPTADPPGPPNGKYKTVRSSAFRSTSSLVPSVLRDSFSPNEYRDDLGFRCVVEKPPYYAPACVYTPLRETVECPPPTLDITDTSCQKKTGIVEFDLSEGAILTSTGCTETSTPNHYICYGASGGLINVTFCSDCEPVEEVCEPTICPCDYTYNMETCECEWSGYGEEPIAGFEIESGGSLLFSLAPSLLLNPSPGCPPGFYWDPLAEDCVPINSPDNCDPAKGPVSEECEVCPPGSTYNQESGCCESDGSLEPVSEAVTTCITLTLKFGVCDKPPQQTGCTKTLASCQAQNPIYQFNETLCCCWNPRTQACVP